MTAKKKNAEKRIIDIADKKKLSHAMVKTLHVIRVGTLKMKKKTCVFHGTVSRERMWHRRKWDRRFYEIS